MCPTFVLLFASLAIAGPATPPAKEFKASIETPGKAAIVRGSLFLPSDRSPVTSVIVILNWGLDVYSDSRWRQMAEDVTAGLLLLTIEGAAAGEVSVREQPARNAAAGGGEGLIGLLGRLASDSGHEELRDVPLLFWGPSAAGSFGITFAMLHPDRTIAFVRYNSHLRDLSVNIEAVRNIPALLLAGGNDQVAGTEDAGKLWRQGRAVSAPWTFGIEPGQRHGEGLERATPFMLSWMRSVIKVRVVEGKLRLIDQSNSWWGDNDTSMIKQQPPSGLQTIRTSWLPDEGTAKLWRAVTRAPG
jgi:hypothetical protein